MAFPVDVDSTWVNPGGISLDGGELRRADTAAFAGIGSALGVGGGIVRHGDTSLAVTVDASDNVTIQPGVVVIPGNAVAGTGCYRASLVNATTNALSARDATYPRVDRIVFRQLDTDVVGTHGAYTARIEAIAGTPSPAPSPPSLPSMAVELARINVPVAGGSAAGVDNSFRSYATAIGGLLIVPSFLRLPASAAKYQKAKALDTGIEYEWNGTAWVGGWASYAAAWTGATTNPVIGNGTIDATYTQVGKTVQWQFSIVIGSTTTLGSGTWSISLPVAAAGHYPTNAVLAVGGISVGPTNVGAMFARVAASKTTVNLLIQGASVDSTHPAAWSAGQSISGFGTYEAA